MTVPGAFPWSSPPASPYRETTAILEFPKMPASTTAGEQGRNFAYRWKLIMMVYIIIMVTHFHVSGLDFP
jgi:hypothetical protein